jgi:TRAP-type mannitol/chloroaromatic compound transport system substrate-binding protein
VLRLQLQSYDAAARKRQDNALWVEIERSQKAFAQRVVRWDLDTNVNRRMAYDHYFAQPAARPAPKKKR